MNCLRLSAVVLLGLVSQLRPAFALDLPSSSPVASASLAEATGPTCVAKYPKLFQFDAAAPLSIASGKLTLGIDADCLVAILGKQPDFGFDWRCQFNGDPSAPVPLRRLLMYAGTDCYHLERTDAAPGPSPYIVTIYGSDPSGNCTQLLQGLPADAQPTPLYLTTLQIGLAASLRRQAAIAAAYKNATPPRTAAAVDTPPLILQTVPN